MIRNLPAVSLSLSRSMISEWIAPKHSLRRNSFGTLAALVIGLACATPATLCAFAASATSISRLDTEPSRTNS